jgi:hypothetical protein
MAWTPDFVLFVGGDPKAQVVEMSQSSAGHLNAISSGVAR